MKEEEINIWNEVAQSINNPTQQQIDTWNDYTSWNQYMNHSDSLYSILIGSCDYKSRLDFIKKLRDCDRFYYSSDRGLYEYKCMVVDKIPCIVYENLELDIAEDIEKRLIMDGVQISILNQDEMSGRYNKSIFKRKIDTDFESQNYEEWDDDYNEE